MAKVRIARSRLYRYKRMRYAGVTKGGRVMAVKRRFYAGRTKKGFLKLYRKLPEMFIQNAVAVGSIQTNDPTGSCLNVGTPILEANNVTYAIPFSMQFRLNQIINHQDITNLCDAYKLKYVNIKLQYVKNNTNVGSPGPTPSVMWVQDHDDSSLPTSVDSVREKMGCRTKRFGMNQQFKIGVQPRVADSIFGTGPIPAYAVAKPRWINSTYDNVQHYAIKGFITNVWLASSTTTLTQFNFDVTSLVYGRDFQ